MDELPPLPIGRRVAAFRKLRGLTQSGLAARMHRSESWVRKIERGERRIDSLSVLDELSRALAVPLYQLTGQYEVRLGEGGRSGPPGLTELRRVLARPATACPTDGEPRHVAALEREVAALTRLQNTATHHISAVLPRLADQISDVQCAVRAGPPGDRPRAFAALAELHRLAANVLSHSGDVPRARVASDRALGAADDSGDTLQLGAVAIFHTIQLWRGGDSTDAVAVAVEVADLVTRDPRVVTPAGTVVLGGLYAYGAIAAAKAGDGSEARRLLKAAGRTSEELGRDREAYGMHFGPANLASKEMYVLLHLDRPQDAVSVAGRVPTDQLGSKYRVGHHCTWLAAAHSTCGDDDRALAILTTGLHTAPEVVRDHFVAREMVHSMLHRRRHVGEELRRIARAMNLPL